jgi:hypothetical protein
MWGLEAKVSVSGVAIAEGKRVEKRAVALTKSGGHTQAGVASTP